MATVVLRTNYLSDPIRAMVDRLQEAGLSIVIAADFSKGLFPTYGLHIVEMNKDRLHEHNLFVGVADPIWQCGDYALYLAMLDIPQENEFWHIESDVRFNMENVGELFYKLHVSSMDCAFVGFAKSPESWHWYRGASQQGFDVYRCHFPVVFATRQVIAYAYQLRVIQSLKMRAMVRNSAEFARQLARDRTLWPNDEGFFASAAKLGNFIVEDLNRFGPFYSSKTLRYEPPFLQDDYDRLSPDGRIYHPVLELEKYIQKSLRHKRPDMIADFADEAKRLRSIGYSAERIEALVKTYAT